MYTLSQTKRKCCASRRGHPYARTPGGATPLGFGQAREKSSTALSGIRTGLATTNRATRRAQRQDPTPGSCVLSVVVCSRALASVSGSSFRRGSGSMACLETFTHACEMVFRVHNPMEAAAPSSSNAPDWPISDIITDLRELSALELADVVQFVKQVRATRGDRPSPQLVAKIVATVERLSGTYSKGIPIPIVRACHTDVPRVLFNQALFEAEARGILHLVAVRSRAPFIDVVAGIVDKRGLLYWIVPAPRGHDGA